MKSVAIVGAGPGGLVAAKILLHSHPNTFSVTVFEKSDQVGGLWNVKNHPRDGFLPPNMPTNLSRFSVGFSDLSWDSMKFGNKPPPMFPKAWQAQEYLEEYVKRYLPRDIFSLRTEVKSVEQILKRSKAAWKIKYSTADSPVLSEKTFDFLLVASGFFAEPRPIQCRLNGFDQKDSPVKIIHSSKYRNLEDVVPSAPRTHGKKILVVGGANSGGEVSAAAAFDISSRLHSPEGDESLDYEIVHVKNRPVYGLPLFVPGNVPGTFIPLDIKLYDLSKRPEGQITFTFGKQSPELSRSFHGLMQSILGTDKYEVGFQPPVSDDAADLPAPYAAIQEHYASYVRSGRIVPKLGQVKSLERSSTGETLTARVEHGSEDFVIEDIAGVLYATGYTPAPGLDFLSKPVKSSLGYDPKNVRLPLLICDDMISSHPSTPDLGFIGCYEGPYWGVMETQARLLAQKWVLEGATEKQEGRSEDSKKREESLRDLRKAMESEKARVPHFIFSDYLAILEEASRQLDLERNDNGWEPRQGIVTPARYLDKGSNRHEAIKTMSSMQDMLQKSEAEGKYAPRVTFRGLQGNWNIHRKLKSVIADFPSGTFTGTASFHPRAPTDSTYDFEYFYIEKGFLVTDQGVSMEGHRRYIYRYEEDTDKISVWFVKQDGKTCDYLYHELDSQKPDPEHREASWIAKGDHLCEADFYSSSYKFNFDGVALKNFTVKHAVKGPKKDYTSETSYER